MLNEAHATYTLPDGKNNTDNNNNNEGGPFGPNVDGSLGLLNRAVTLDRLFHIIFGNTYTPTRAWGVS